jgi:hypothetical protein
MRRVQPHENKTHKVTLGVGGTVNHKPAHRPRKLSQGIEARHPVISMKREIIHKPVEFSHEKVIMCCQTG